MSTSLKISKKKKKKKKGTPLKCLDFFFQHDAEQRFDLNSLFTILYENTVLKYSRLSSVRRSTGFIETEFFFMKYYTET